MRLVALIVLGLSLCSCGRVEQMKVAEARNRVANQIGYGTISGIGHRAAAKFLIKFGEDGKAVGLFQDLVGGGMGDVDVEFTDEGMKFTATVVAPQRCAAYAATGILNGSTLANSGGVVEITLTPTDPKQKPVKLKMNFAMSNTSRALDVNLRTLADNETFSRSMLDNINEGLNSKDPVLLPGYRP